MKRTLLKLAAPVVLLAIIATATVAMAQQQNWTYKCPRCGLILTFATIQGVPRCPNDGSAMQSTR